jgi:photosystem II stability/assembly factor-like uncharacterized protein
VYGTTDGGETWSVLFESGSLGRFPEKIRFASSQVGYGVSFQSFFKTVDGGVTWQTLDSDAGTPLDSPSTGPHNAVRLDFSGDGTGYALNGAWASATGGSAYPLWTLSGKASGVRKPSRRSRSRKHPAWPYFRPGALFDAAGHRFSASTGF